MVRSLCRARQDRWWDGESERLGGLEIDHQLESDRLQPACCRDNDRQVECWILNLAERAQPLHNPDITSFRTSASWAQTLFEGNSLASK